ncbi:MAG: hypothetical protein M3Y30_02840 [Gemmatimonadota bacterium]|nr:hypothetical protein [Gemmatimonadota bacterium]
MADQPKSLDGSTTVDEKVVFEAQRLSYEAARNIAEKIARRISERTRGREVVVAGTQLLADYSNLVALKSVLEELAEDYDALVQLAHVFVLGPVHQALVEAGIFDARSGAGVGAAAGAAVGAITSGFSAVTAGVQGALTLVELFRQDVDYKGVPIAIDTLAFELELASRLRMHKAKDVVVPAFAVFAAPARGESAFRTLLENVHEARAGVLRAIGPKKPAAKKKPEPAFPEIEHQRHDYYLADEPTRTALATPEQIHDALAEVDKRFSDVQVQLEKVDADGSGLTLMARLFRVETIMSRSPILVHARVVLAGGNNRVQKSLFRTLFTGDGLSSTGGAVVSWAILSTHGAVEDGGIFSESRSARSPKPPESQLSIA